MREETAISTSFSTFSLIMILNFSLFESKKKKFPPLLNCKIKRKITFCSPSMNHQVIFELLALLL